MATKRTIFLTREQKAKILAEMIEGYRLFDDEFMSSAFADKSCLELVIRVVLKDPSIEVFDVKVQYVIPNLRGRGIRIDVWCKKPDGTIFCCEVQRADKGAPPERARYISGVVDANILVKGDDFKELPTTYVILITENDILGGGLPLYHVSRQIEELKKSFGDRSHIIYVNGAYKGDDDIGKLVHDFSCVNPDDMNYKTLADQVNI